MAVTRIRESHEAQSRPVSDATGSPPADAVLSPGEVPAPTLVCVGAGPRALGVLERLAATLRTEPVPEAPLRIHLVDPFPPGAGRIWRRDQSPLLKLNSMAGEVTVFTDDTSTVAGPIVPGPSLLEWAELVRSGGLPDVVIDDEGVRTEIAGLVFQSFPTRRLNSYYLEWFAHRVESDLADYASVAWHRSTATSVQDDCLGDPARPEVGAPPGTAVSQRVTLADGTVLAADVVLIALGHNGRDATPEQSARLDFARRNNLLYVPPAFTADADLTDIRPGEPVIVRGFGLAAIDLIVLLAEGRGGRFERAADGQLTYHPSGREPRVHVGSRRGVPYRSKISSTLCGDAPEPRFFTREVVRGCVEAGHPVDFRRDIWPLIARDLHWGYYRELFTGHPERVSRPWAEVAEGLAECLAATDSAGGPDGATPGSGGEYAAVAEWAAAVVPDPADRFDLADFDRPLGVAVQATRVALQDAVAAHISADLSARTRPEGSATLGLFQAALGAYLLVAEIPEDRWTARSRVIDVPVWWQSFFSYVASGPPGHRLEEVVALARAGILNFLGPRVWLREEPARAGYPAGFAAGSPAVDHTVRARVLVDAWLPESRAALSDSPALRHLVTSGGGVELAAADADFSGSTGRVLVSSADSRVVTVSGEPHPARFAVGPFTTAINAGAFSRPRINALPFRENDRVALGVLAALRAAARVG
ncbi:FAD/NAD(P)-binding protein [Klugiella xanthotipulae]|uniref:FAD-NAD(P)-binding protein n=1 Tax=Klugiella xanthotipulae TaxID=244735 RepID=A0A543HZA3_9MICO|nr:FAD/NAD(P)-binding protein [Klugiella xanthotipulae]TQM63595.1 FAD-NAD(P)-binding protein [Klugiella xanthotipulae]